MSAITITNNGLNLLRDGMQGTSNPKITYVALGTDSTTPAVTDTQLGAEVFRKVVSSYTTGSTGETLVNMFLSPSDLVGTTVSEVGFFGGNASATANSGVLLAHGLYSHTHLGTESIQFTLDYTFS